MIRVSKIREDDIEYLPLLKRLFFLEKSLLCLHRKKEIS